MKRKSTNKNENLTITSDDILKSLPGHIFWKDTEGNYLGCNDLQAIDLGFSDRQEIVGKKDADILQYQSMAAQLRKSDIKCMTTKKPIFAEEWGMIDGKNRVLLNQKIPLQNNDGKVVGVLGISQDVSAYKQYLKKLNESKSNFINMMSHDIASPISNIINTLDALSLALSKKENELLNFWNVAYEEAHLTLKKVRDMVDYLTFDADSFFKKESKINVGEMISKVLKKYDERDKAKIKFVFSMSDNFNGVDLSVPDSAALYKVIDTIVENAMRYTLQGEIKISVILKENKKSKRHSLAFTIADTGVGIYKKELDFIMKCCVDGYASNEKADLYSKVSIRIPYAYLLATKILEGSLAISSVVDEGTQVTLKIPCTLKTVPKNKSRIFNGLSVLLVEDNQHSQHFENKLLSSLGLIVDVVATATDAISRCKNIPYDIIFLDITLPDMSGVEAMPYLTTASCNPDIVIAAMTSHSSENDIDHFNSIGIASVIPKPIQVEQVTLFLETYLQHRPGAFHSSS